MGRFFVPAVFVATISGIAFGLIVGIVARSPETHANVRPEGYDRTPIIYVGDEPTSLGFGLADAGIVTNVDQGTRGRLLFLSSSCVACHGLAGRGGVIGPDLDTDELSLSEFRREVRSGPKGMPAFTEVTLSDDAIDALYAFLEATRREASMTSRGSSVDR